MTAQELPGGQSITVSPSSPLLLIIGGAFVGMTSAALAELLELLPVMIVSSRVASMALPSVLALMLGKALGAVLAALVGI